MGLDIEFILNHQLRKPVLAAIIEHKNQIQEAIGRKAAMDEWRPLNLQTTNVSHNHIHVNLEFQQNKKKYSGSGQSQRRNGFLWNS